MAILKRPRREKFAQNIIKGLKAGGSYTDAYLQAGYRGDGHTAEVGASRLMSQDEIRNRIDELTRPAVRKVGVTVASLLAELATTIEDARRAKQHGTVVAALTLSAKLVGLLKDQVEVGGPGSFDRPSTIEEMIAELGNGDAATTLLMIDEIVADVRADLQAAAAAHAKIVDAPAPTPRRSEAAISLAMLRPTRPNSRQSRDL
ncbi:hypothetical protein V1283_003439 [Bradyrhizobium sp. AZCC 2262]|uniref:hypothetical protein n=1 Tax=Bradyrhizobium sp. AZCC 2262 TaxID=3117022 RepID=UPI002FF265E0